MLKTGHGLDQARSGLGPAVFFCYTHIFSLFFLGLLRYRSRSRCSLIDRSLPSGLARVPARSQWSTVALRLARRSSGLAPLSHTSIHLYIPLHSLFSYFYFPYLPDLTSNLTSSPAGRRPCSPSASRHLGTPTSQSYLLPVQTLSNNSPCDTLDTRDRHPARRTCRACSTPALAQLSSGALDHIAASTRHG